MARLMRTHRPARQSLRTEALPPQLDRLIADPVFLGDLDDRCRVALLQDHDHLLLVVSTLAHVHLADPRSNCSKFQLVRKSPGEMSRPAGWIASMKVASSAVSGAT